MGQFKIIPKLADGNEYVRVLLQDQDQIHPTFHISLLNPFKYLAENEDESNGISEHMRAFHEK